MLRKNKKKTGLTAKIKNYMDGVTIDVFGYEKKVSENVTSYLGTISDTHRIPLSNVNIRITKPAGELKADIYYLDGHVRKATLNELVDFFMGEGTTKVFDLEVKVKKNVSDYLEEYSEEKGIAIQALNIRISKPNKQVMVVAYNQAEYVDGIPLKELIKYFKA